MKQSKAVNAKNKRGPSEKKKKKKKTLRGGGGGLGPSFLWGKKLKNQKARGSPKKKWGVTEGQTINRPRNGVWGWGKVWKKGTPKRGQQKKKQLNELGGARKPGVPAPAKGKKGGFYKNKKQEGKTQGEHSRQGRKIEGDAGRAPPKVKAMNQGGQPRDHRKSGHKGGKKKAIGGGETRGVGQPCPVFQKTNGTTTEGKPQKFPTPKKKAKMEKQHQATPVLSPLKCEKTPQRKVENFQKRGPNRKKKKRQTRRCGPVKVRRSKPAGKTLQARPAKGNRTQPGTGEQKGGKGPDSKRAQKRKTKGPGPKKGKMAT